MDSDWDFNANNIVLDTFEQLLLDDQMKISRKRKASSDGYDSEKKNLRPEGEQHTFDSIITG